MMTSVCPVESERGEFAGEMIRCLPDLNMGIVSDCNVPIRDVVKMTSRNFLSNSLSIWRELHILDRLFEIKVVKNCSTSEIYK